jgi:predicted signal transduction protein with EAL and GGDEF domain
VAYPLRLTDELQGLLAIRVAQRSLFSDALPYLHRLADQVAVALGNIRMVDQIRRLAFYEPVTTLPNRAHYYRRLASAMKQRTGTTDSVAICTIDLDRFHQINGTLGPKLGDQLLFEVGSRFAACFGQDQIDPPGFGQERPEADRILFHLGADQFAVIVTGPGAMETATATASILLHSLKVPFRLGPEEVVISASAGIAVFPKDGSDAESLHKNAEVSLSYAKASGLKAGGSGVEVYVPAMGSERMSRLQLERDLRRALEREEFRLVYQPIVDLETGKVAGAEALVRWEHPERGILSPATFISRCEESGLILPLGDWILRQVCAQIASWKGESPMGRLRISVNMSARQFMQRTAVERVERTVRDAGIDPHRLCLELTESCLMEGSEVSQQKVRDLAALGVAVAIDDFGTGYSSLAYLKNFPVSALKIDRSFTSGLPNDPDSAALTRAVIALGSAMELDIVAEGVENRAQAAFLRKRGCGKAQGYLYGQGLSAEEFQAEVSHPGLRAS